MKIQTVLIVILIIGNIVGWSLFNTRGDTINEYQRQVEDLQSRIDVLEEDNTIAEDSLYETEHDLNQMREALYPLYRSGEVQLTEEQEWILKYPMQEAELTIYMLAQQDTPEAKEALEAWRKYLDYLRKQLGEQE